MSTGSAVADALRRCHLRPGSGVRKATGTFYTPQPIADYLLRDTLTPLVHGATPESDSRSLKVLDPAMGSGAFLVGACRYLADAYESALIDAGRCHAGRHRARRSARPSVGLVAERCLFGVDINPTFPHVAADERITSALPDSTGRIWFVSKRNGVVGTLYPKSRRVRLRRMGDGAEGQIENSFATGAKGAVYIATNRRMYRFRAGSDGRPKVVWSVKYRNSGIVKPGQVDDGTGTTPTVLPGGYVSITDNADPMNVVVYRTGARLHGKRRTVCQVPVFKKGASATENSLIGAGRSLVVENNYGYQDPLGPNTGQVTEPGFARVDIRRNGRGCVLRWTNRTARAPTVVPKLSLKTGLIYTYTRPPDPAGSEPYYWTAIDFRTGRTVLEPPVGHGPHLQQQLRRDRSGTRRNGVSGRASRRNRGPARRVLASAGAAAVPAGSGHWTDISRVRPVAWLTWIV